MRSLERWKINLYVLWLTQVLSLMSFGLFAPFIPIYLRELGITDIASVNLWTGIMSFTPSAAMVIAAPIWGILSDRYGKKIMLVRALACASALMVGMALVTNVWQLLFLRACQGFFTGTVTASMAFVGSNTPEDRMSYALGFLSSSGFIGYSIGPVIGGFLVDLVGMRMCFITAAVSMSIGLLLAIILLKERPAISTLKEKSENKIKVDYRKLFTLSIVMILLMLLTTRMIRSIFGPYITLFVEHLLGTTQGAARWTGIINGAVCIVSAVATLTIVRLGDKYDKVKILLILTLITLPFAILSSMAGTLMIFALIYTIFAFSSGAMEPLLTSAASEKIPPEMRGSLFGFIGMVNNAGFMLAPILGSYVSVTYSVKAILILIPIFVVLQLIVAFFSLKIEKRFTI